MSSSHRSDTPIILHALYNPHQPFSFILFGEDKDSGSIPISGGTDSGPNHPFASSAEHLSALIKLNLKEGREQSAPCNSSCKVEFPIAKGEIVVSPEFASLHRITQREPDSSAFFQVPVVVCQSELLFHLPEGNPSGAWIDGGSLRFWRACSRLAREMVIRGRYLPSSGIYQNGGVCTRWKLIPSSYDEHRIDSLARVMPPIQQSFLRYAEGSRITGRKETVILFIESIIARIIFLTTQTHPEDLISRFTPIERLKYSQELTALYYLQGYERHKMPITNPQITNGWKGKFDQWTNTENIEIPDDLPWTVVARIDEDIATSSSKEKQPPEWVITFLVKSADHSDILVPASRLDPGKTAPIPLPGEDELKKLLQDAALKVQTAATLPESQVTFRSRFDPVIRIPESDLIRFLSHDVPRIRESGIEFICPDWWGRPLEPARINLSFQRQQEKDFNSMVGLASLLHYDYRIAIGDDFIEPAAFRQMVEQQITTVRAGRRWVTIDRPALDLKIKAIEKQYKKHRVSVAELLKMVARSESPDGDLSINPGDDWTSDLITGVREGWSHTKVQIPQTFNGTLRPYQEIGVSFLLRCRSLGFGACLADDMGLGKTPQTIAYLLCAKENKGLSGPSLIICPTSVIGNWERELTRFAPGLSCFVHHGSSRLKGKAFLEKAQSYDLIITSYALIPRDMELLSGLTYAVLILDEVQNVKNPQTKQFQAVRVLEADHRIALTGTPVENHLTELWALMETINPGYLGSFTTFQKMYATPIEKGGADEKAAELRRIIRPFLLRRVKTDKTVISDLPEKMEMEVYCTLTHEQAALYQSTVNDLARDLQSVAGIARKGRVLSALTRLKQICNYPEHGSVPSLDPARSGKVQRLVEMLEEVRDEGDGAIIFTQYATFAKDLARTLHQSLEREVLLLTGSTPRMKREEMIARFAKSDGPRFFVISLRAGGTGLNLMQANHVFHIDRWWNPAVEDQATDRTYRIGQTKTVQVHMMITAGTLEEQIHEMIARKRTVADQVISAGEDWLTELPNGELMDVLRLREQVFGDDI
ncbi:MAG TPA: DEAD/DEAH box helicase [Methanospirillum sp.]|uniref:DEAD/DEAH box helicase n=1 Tax=Methanospirillum sp. TaxID=45200 RepID=UPI002BBE3BDB|nr:DEAD/DEAH box helicase [Methanospirillum sp.]HWQ65031.1 DEAD/DEAH box helicase [Methanospirillum sp.]